MSEGRLWRGLEELAGTDEFQASVAAEFPAVADLFATDRRALLQVMGASLGLIGLAGCSPKRSDDAVPFVNRPEDMIDDQVAHYATAIPLDGYAQPVIATSVAGRPIKLDGNPDHPMSRGASSLFTQAAILDLYDPDRSQAPIFRGNEASWADYDAMIVRMRRAWAANGGDGLRLLIGPTSSPTLIRQLDALTAALPNARVHAFDPLAGEAPFEARPDLAAVRTVVSLDDDLLGPGPAQVPNVAAWASRRGPNVPAKERLRLFMAETTPTQTGSTAFARLGVSPSRVPLLAGAIAAGLGLGPAQDGLTRPEAQWAAQVAAALKRDPGLVTAGAHCPAAVHALAFRINEALGTRAVRYIASVRYPGTAFGELVRDLEAGRVSTLIVLDANPAYAAPADVDFARLYRRVPLRIHAGLHVDETAILSDWHLPLPHMLEDWSDARAVDGSATIIQPLVDPLYDTRSVHGIVAGLTGDPAPSRELVRATWPMDEQAWREAVRAGIIPDSAAAPVTPGAFPAPPAPAAAGEVEILFRPDPTIRDGRFANNGWLQELGKPLMKVTWDNVVALSVALADRLGVGNGDLVRVSSGGRSIAGPAWVMPGQPERSVTLFLGYGRRRAGRVGSGVGYDAYALRSSAAPWTTFGRIEKVAGHHALATTQLHHALEGQDLVRTVSAAHPEAARPEERDQASFYPRWKEEDVAWAMTIDLDLCTGCNACTIACQAENNVPVVGKDQVARGREMHWLRIDRYYDGPPEQPQTYFQPVPCMHCEQAPCEMGCPVHATVHGPDGLNEMVYNRCIGTRTCSSYCPYKVRRFNWFDYTTKAPESVQAQRNPDVTVRGRGVMEKCTYCVQRIRGAVVQADIEKRDVRDGEVRTACQQACPSQAIVFGNLKDAGSAVAKGRASPRNYALLGELDTRPRTTYLARIADEEA
ncbi:TAT-variant-translocated molybdopterin oxidoreductase [Sphingomonas sp.]|uniref:TAT-variant-translocated molybdopterin oxidoreductase n=1 Tax=Sphingomonas sp. TaxID=28214 RepID=UPI002DB9D77D|nr:TAT-variant-translocated molybdopterin oxidoreductase [Sphingomonas sp.]HEU4970236.1 TAT-variant-translocated molybdopterin oxidoreductase [Sphingomonas sp.]